MFGCILQHDQSCPTSHNNNIWLRVLEHENLQRIDVSFGNCVLHVLKVSFLCEIWCVSLDKIYPVEE